MRVMTFNVARLFDAICQSGNCSPGDYEPLPSQSEVDARVTQLADAIRAHHPDVVVMQEIETESLLFALRDTLDDGYTAYGFGEIGGSATVDVGILAKGQFVEVRRHRNQVPLQRADGGVTRFSREFLELHVTVDAQRVIVFAAHFKSKADDDPERRLLEATAAHDVVVQRLADFPDSMVVLAGDLNDTPGSAPLNALEAGGQLYRVNSVLSGAQAYTYYLGTWGNVLDHIFVRASHAAQVVTGTVGVERDVPGSREGLGGSDHAAVKADLLLP